MSLEGRLEDLGLPDIFQIIGLSKRSGALTIVRQEGTGRLVFCQGQVVYASSDNKSRLGYTLVKKGLISNKDLENALKTQKLKGVKKPIGTILLDAGAIDRNTLEKEIKNHVVEVVRDLMTWESGSFHFELGDLVEGDVALKSGINPEFLLLEGARITDEEEREKGKAHEVKAQSRVIKEKEISGSTTAEEEKTRKEAKPGAETEPVTAQSQTKHLPQGRKDLVLLTSMIAELSGPSTSSEITLLILRFASELMNRAVLFLVKKEYIAGLGQFGIVFKEGSADVRIRDVKIPLNEESLLRDVIEKKTTFKGQLPSGGWNDYLVEQLECERPLEVFVSPLISDGKVIGLLYGDNFPNRERIAETDGLEAFIKVSGVAFGKVLLERRLQETRTPEPSAGR
ncbi:MAG: DUF4388 domain-containing protein [Nitrospirae bacterium]|nr:DUF4388 domain-containing protein [Nitrospirota bacterium]